MQAELFGEVHNLFPRTYESLYLALPLRIIFTRMNCHFDCCHVGLSPPIKTVQNLNKVFFTVLHCHRIGLFGLYHFEIPRIVNNIQLVRNIFEQIKYLANVDVEAKSILGVRHGSGLCILVIDFPRGVFRIFHHLNAFLIHINIIISDSKFNCSFM